MADRFVAVFLQPLCQLFNEGTKFGAGLFAPFVLLVGYAATDYVFNCVAGKVEFTSNLTNCFAVSEISQTDFNNERLQQCQVSTCDNVISGDLTL